LWSDGSWEGIAKTITDGVSQPKQYRSPMAPMGGAQLTPEQVKAVAAYVWAISHLAKSNSSSAGAPAEIAGPGQRIFPEAPISTSDGRLIIGGIDTRSIFSVDRGAFAEGREICGGSGNSQGIQPMFATLPGATNRELPRPQQLRQPCDKTTKTSILSARPPRDDRAPEFARGGAES
jgi:hypothetical protein